MQTDNFENDINEELEEELLYQAIEENLQKEEKNDSNENSENSEKENLEETTEENQEEDKRKKRIIGRKKRIKRELKIKTVLAVILALLVNTYAWFIYISVVTTKVNIHVKSWDFELSVADQSQNFDFTVEQVYPGMPSAKKEIIAKNNGETEAVLTCEINKIRIFDEEIVANQEYEMEDGSRVTYTPKELLEKLLTDYPFKVKIFVNDQQYNPEQEYPLTNGELANVYLQVDWDFETGEVAENGIADGDEKDTYYGQKSYEFMQDPANEGKYSMVVELVIKATQKNTP